LHCLVPAGALSHDQMRWTPARKNFLFPVKALSVVLCGKFLDLLKSAFARNQLLSVGQTASLADSVAFNLLINASRKKPWPLDAHEFIRRFLLHVIPKGFVRVRHFGFLANRSKSLLSKCRQLLNLGPALPKLPQKSVHELMLQLTGIDITRCPLCHKGTLVFLADLRIVGWDSS